ncbi:MAG: nucleoside deaminase [Gammaproteobacteria bacterium]|nr:nucleoside deaminase [Gammaproteobacteria bacterium]
MLNPEYFMQLAIEQALLNPDYPFGAIAVHRTSHEIVATGFNQASHNPTLHGEMVAINNSAAQHPSLDWQELDLYTTAEPCAMCQSAILWAGIAKAK